MTSREYYIHKGYFKPYEGINFYPTPEHVKEYAEYYHQTKSQLNRQGIDWDELDVSNTDKKCYEISELCVFGRQLSENERAEMEYGDRESRANGRELFQFESGFKICAEWFRTRIQSLVVGDAVEYDEIKELMELHVAFKVFLLRKDFLAVNAMLNSFSDADDINVLKMVLVITKTFKDETLIKHERERILFAYNRKYDSLPPSPTK